MSRYRGEIIGNRKVASRLGTPNSGLTVKANGWNVGVEVVARPVAELGRTTTTRDGAEPLAVLGGDKVRAFYRAICGDHHAVVLDAHMLRAARFKKPKTTPREYARIAARLRAEARQHGERPAAFQAIVWCHIRGKAE